jgi:hypothetical protein
VIIDGRRSKVADHDVIEIIRDFIVNAQSRNISVEVVGLPFLNQVKTENNYQIILEKEITHHAANT